MVREAAEKAELKEASIKEAALLEASAQWKLNSPGTDGKDQWNTLVRSPSEVKLHPACCLLRSRFGNLLSRCGLLKLSRRSDLIPAAERIKLTAQTIVTRIVSWMSRYPMLQELGW